MGRGQGIITDRSIGMSVKPNSCLFSINSCIKGKAIQNMWKISGRSRAAS